MSSARQSTAFPFGSLTGLNAASFILMPASMYMCIVVPSSRPNQSERTVMTTPDGTVPYGQDGEEGLSGLCGD